MLFGDVEIPDVRETTVLREPAAVLERLDFDVAEELIVHDRRQPSAVDAERAAEYGGARRVQIGASEIVDGSDVYGLDAAAMDEAGRLVRRLDVRPLTRDAVNAGAGSVPSACWRLTRQLSNCSRQAAIRACAAAGASGQKGAGGQKRNQRISPTSR